MCHSDNKTHTSDEETRGKPGNQAVLGKQRYADVKAESTYESFSGEGETLQKGKR